MLVAAPLVLFGIRSSLPLHGSPNLVICWLTGSLTVIIWHVPAVFELALRSTFWHAFEHVNFFLAGIVFWWPALHSGLETQRWSLPIYFFLATLPCDVLSAFLVFCGHVVYAPYSSGPRYLNPSPLNDQELAGALMWVTVTFAYLIPAIVMIAGLLSDERRHTARIVVS
jgi:putative membrane protein